MEVYSKYDKVNSNMKDTNSETTVVNYIFLKLDPKFLQNKFTTQRENSNPTTMMNLCQKLSGCLSAMSEAKLPDQVHSPPMFSNSGGAVRYPTNCRAIYI